MKFSYIILFTIFFSFSLSASPTEKADELCSCLKNAQSTQKKKDKSKCLTMREKHVKVLKKNSADHETYLSHLQQCEREIGGLPEVKADLSVDEKIKIVCDCFSSVEKSNKMKCFKLQSDYGKTIPAAEDKQRFNLDSGSCDK